MTTYVARSCQFSAEIDVLVLSSGSVDVGPQDANINSLSPSGHPAPLSTNSSSIHDFGGLFLSPDLGLLSRHTIGFISLLLQS
jgi:hypothetical protein